MVRPTVNDACSITRKMQVLPDARRGRKLSEAGLAGTSAARLGPLGTVAQPQETGHTPGTMVVWPESDFSECRL